LADKVLTAAGFDFADVEAVSATVAGVVDRESGRVVLAPNLHWRDYPLRDSLTEAFGKPASVHNVTHAAAVAEGADGAAREARQFVWVYIGTGVGAGIMLDGQLFTGQRGFAGELGHCPVADGGPLCACGRRGCLETVASAPAVVRIAEEACRSRRRTSLRDVDPLDAGAVVAAAQAGDDVAIEILATVGNHLGRGIAYLLNILNPGLIVVGGALAGAGDLLLDPVRLSVAEHALAATQTEIVGSVLGDRAEIIGAVRLAMDEQASSHRIVRRAFRPATA
jgi:glucokinase-like ROK family protein